MEPITGIAEVARVAATATEGAAKATAPAATVAAEGAADVAPIVTAPVVEGAGVAAGEVAGAMAPQASEASATLLSSADQAASADLAERADPPDAGALKRIATGGNDAWGAPEPKTSAAEREMAAQSVLSGGPPAPGEASTETPDPTAQVDGGAPVLPPTPDAPVPATESSRAPVEDRLAEAASNKQRAAEAAEKARKEGASPEEISRLEQEAKNADEHYKTVVSERDQAIIEATISLQNEKITEMSDQLTKALESNLEQGAMIEELQDQVKQLADALGKVAKIAEKKASDEDKLTLKKIIELLILAFGKQIVGDFTTTVTAPVGKTGR